MSKVNKYEYGFVHRRKISHSRRRKVWRRLVKDGKAEIKSQNKDGWYYKRIKQGDDR